MRPLTHTDGRTHITEQERPQEQFSTPNLSIEVGCRWLWVPLYIASLIHYSTHLFKPYSHSTTAPHFRCARGAPGPRRNPDKPPISLVTLYIFSSDFSLPLLTAAPLLPFVVGPEYRHQNEEWSHRCFRSLLWVSVMTTPHS